MKWARVLQNIGFRELKQRQRGTRAQLLDVNKGPGKLDQPFVKIRMGLAANREPEFFKNLVCLKEFSTVKPIKKAGVMRIVQCSDEAKLPSACEPVSQSLL